MHPFHGRIAVARDSLAQIVPAVREVAGTLIHVFGVSGHGCKVSRTKHFLFDRVSRLVDDDARGKLALTRQCS